MFNSSISMADNYYLYNLLNIQVHNPNTLILSLLLIDILYNAIHNLSKSYFENLYNNVTNIRYIMPYHCIFYNLTYILNIFILLNNIPKNNAYIFVYSK
jgi:hypothetical protein